MRWLAVAGQVLTLYAASGWLQLPVSLGPLISIFLFTAASNVALSVMPEKLRCDPRTLPGVLLVDVFLLTLLLYFSGGPGNPFSILYLLHVVICAVLLDRVWAWGVAVLTILLFALLFVSHVPIESLHQHAAPGQLNAHLLGMWIAYSLVALISAYCIGRMSEELRRSERETMQLKLSQQRLASLTTLAAGAAHELATPMGTIAIILGELERRLGSSASAGASEDLRLMKSELERCKNILSKMGARSGETAGEMPESVSLSALIVEAEAQFARDFGPRVQVAPVTEDSYVSVPKNAVLQALSAITKNAVESTNGGGAVRLAAQIESGVVHFKVSDLGCGMSEEVLSRVGEPFFTTKEAGSGMGLGIFLARLTAEQLGGNLSLESEPGIGTKVDFSVPM